MATTITARIAGLGLRRIAVLATNKFAGYASVGGKKVKVKKKAGKGNANWTVA